MRGPLPMGTEMCVSRVVNCSSLVTHWKFQCENYTLSWKWYAVKHNYITQGVFNGYTGQVHVSAYTGHLENKKRTAKKVDGPNSRIAGKKQEWSQNCSRTQM
jgi:hypothetical protein